MTSVNNDFSHHNFRQQWLQLTWLQSTMTSVITTSGNNYFSWHDFSQQWLQSTMTSFESSINLSSDSEMFTIPTVSIAITICIMSNLLHPDNKKLLNKRTNVIILLQSHWIKFLSKHRKPMRTSVRQLQGMRSRQLMENVNYKQMNMQQHQLAIETGDVSN